MLLGAFCFLAERVPRSHKGTKLRVLCLVPSWHEYQRGIKKEIAVNGTQLAHSPQSHFLSSLFFFLCLTKVPTRNILNQRGRENECKQEQEAKFSKTSHNNLHVLCCFPQRL
jgi:hypothetical protein